MPIINGKSIVFHRSLTLVLQVSILVSAVLFFFYIVPGIDVEFTGRGLRFGLSTIYTSLLIAFAVSSGVAFIILFWRAWIVFLKPIWDRVNDA